MQLSDLARLDGIPVIVDQAELHHDPWWPYAALLAPPVELGARQRQDGFD
jgi:hypothetical protein